MPTKVHCHIAIVVAYHTVNLQLIHDHVYIYIKRVNPHRYSGKLADFTF